MVYIFLRVNGIPFESRSYQLVKREHDNAEFEKINVFKKVPAIAHDGFNVMESVAILRYLCREFKVADHWYPREDSRAQARVDEYLEWQHLNVRKPLVAYLIAKAILPMRTGQQSPPEELERLMKDMDACLDQIENIWLRDGAIFLTGQEISIADIVGACEIEHPRMVGYDPRKGRPKLSAWLDRVAKATSPHYEDALVRLEKVVVKKSFDID
ncbi:hypothetical protein TKK_0012151 [Trichogramma kaykai]|uniref:Glutathione transferase n=1 Tax=Trichogramma kaykai TaxID=54128 RepID=A0ABD2WN86_9HYME